MPKLSTVIFDLGGTLIEYAGSYTTWPDLETPGFTAVYQHLRQKGAQLPPFAQFRDTGFTLLPGRWQAAVAGKQNLRLVELLHEVVHACCGQNGIAPEWVDEAATLYEDAIRAQAHALEGAQATLAHVKEQGFMLGLISNTMFSGRAHINDLRRYGLDTYFDTMLFSGDAGMWKPQPEPYLHVLQTLGGSPETAVFIGDSPEHDVVGAQNAGLRAILIRSSQRFPHPPHVQPDATIQRLAELPALLARWA